MKFINKLKKISYLEIVFIILLIALIIVFLFKPNREGFIEEKKEFIRKTGNDVFDDFYIDIYDDLLYNNNKNLFEIARVVDNNYDNAEILDIGSGTGHHVNLLNNDNNTVIGIDNSPAMINIAKQNYPDLDFRLANALDSMQFPANSFTHITCFYFTIYYIKDKKQFLENCFKWLKPHGELILHLVNINKFDPIIPVANPFVVVSPQSYVDDRITESKVTFNNFNYKSDFQLDKTVDIHSFINKPNAIFKETFKFNNGKKARINEHNLYMSSQQYILSLAREIGFILKSQVEMDSIQYENNYLYTLVKPS